MRLGITVWGMMTAAGERLRRWELSNDFERAEAIGADIVEWLDVQEADGRADLVLAVSEALSNAMIHGNLEVSSSLREIGVEIYLATARSRRETPPYSSRQVRVEAWRMAEMVGIRITDEGRGFDPDAVKLDGTRVSGRGLLLIRESMDEVSFNPKGNQITMVKRLRRVAEGT